MDTIGDGGDDGTALRSGSARTSWRRLRRPIAKVMLAGFIATSVMNLLMFWPRVGGWPTTDIAQLIANVLPGGSAGMLNMNWWIGMGLHYLNGVVLFPLLFVFAADPWLPGGRVARGLIFSLLLWMLIESVAMPLLGAGPFGSRLGDPLRFTTVYLLGHVGYGLLLGGMAGAKGGLAARIELARRRTRRLAASGWSDRALAGVP